MKRLVLILVSLIGLLSLMTVYAAPKVNVQIRLQQAKKVYNALTGPMVTNEGAAGHLYRTGKNVICKYINVDMNDAHGHPIPNNDARRYSCVITLDYNGIAMPTS